MPLEHSRRVISHPQATPQCARFLREQLAARRARSVAGSTAEAVRTVAEADEPWAAIGSKLAAELYGAVVLAEGIEDHPGNETRFVWLPREGAEPNSATPTKTSIVFWGFNDVSPGALVDVLTELSVARHQPHEDRVAPAPRRRAWPLHVLRGPRRRRPRPARERSARRARGTRLGR